VTRHPRLIGFLVSAAIVLGGLEIGVRVFPVDRSGSMSGASPFRTAFPVSQAGRHPRRHFRGLLRLHSALRPEGSPTTRSQTPEFRNSAAT